MAGRARRARLVANGVALMARFSDRGQAEIYDLFRETPPVRRSTGGLAAAYWRGADHPKVKPPYMVTSLAHAAWTAGRAAANTRTKETT